MPGPVRIQAAYLRGGDRDALGQHELGLRIAVRHDHIAPVRLMSSTSTLSLTPSSQTTEFTDAVDSGPCRYSSAGYASLHADAASWIFRAASRASPTDQPRPRKT